MKTMSKCISILAAAVLITACGSDDSGSGDKGTSPGTAPATAPGTAPGTAPETAPGTAPATTSAGGASSDAVSSDLIIGVMSSVSGAEVVDRWANSVTSALDQIGIKTVVSNGEGHPAVMNQVLSSYITQKVDAIVIAAPLYTGPISQALKDAKDAGIPVFAVGGSRVEDPDGLLMQYAVSPSELGNALGEYLVDKYPSGTQWVHLDLPAIAAAHEPIVAGKKVLDAAGWKLVGNRDLDAADFFEKTGPAVVDLLRGNPDAKVLFSCCDYVPGVAVPALQRAGFEKVLIAAEFDNLTTLDLIRDGKPVITVATNTDISIAVAIDQLLIVLGGGKADPTADEGLYKYTVLDSTNLPAKGEYAYPPQDTLAPYVKKWLAEYPGLKG